MSKTLHPHRSSGAPARNAVVVDVVVTGTSQRVNVLAEDRAFAGRVLHRSGSLAIGDEIHIQLDVEDAQSRLILSGEVTGFRSERAPKSTPVSEGLRFLMLVQRATVRGHDVAPATFVDVAPGRSTRLATEEVPTPKSKTQALAFDEFHVDYDLDATEVLSPALSASASPVAPPTSEKAFALDADEEDDTLVMPQVNALPSSILSAPHRLSVPDSSRADATRDLVPPQTPPRSKAPRPRKVKPRENAPLSTLPQRPTTGNEELTGVTGRIERMGVVEVLQSLEVLGRTGRIDFASDNGATGSIYVEGGRLRHALFNGLTGREAVVELLQLTRGHFRIRFDRTCEVQSLDGPSNFLLFDCMREVDERKAAKENGPVTAVGPAPAKVRDRQARERRRKKARARDFALAPPR